jgi:hypothetical protein
MLALVDYDNIHQVHKQRGLAYIAQRIADAIGYSILNGRPRLRLRLYGGWFEGTTITRRAQSLLGQIAGFPMTVTVTAGSTSHSLIAAAEMAVGLLPEPRVYLTHTLRRRVGSGGVSCSAPPITNCALPATCPLHATHTFLLSSQCPVASCAVTTDTALSKWEQKLVDTLLVADLLYLAHTDPEPLAIVSTDDDMWPGIRLALLKGVQIVHVHPVPGRSTPTHYIVSLPTGYSQTTLN